MAKDAKREEKDSGREPEGREARDRRAEEIARGVPFDRLYPPEVRKLAHMVANVIESRRPAIEQIREALPPKGDPWWEESSELRADDPAAGEEFAHVDDYSAVTLHGRSYRLKGRAAEVVRILDTAREAGQAWVHKERIATELNHAAGDFRPRDCFASRQVYADLTESDGKGFYRLKV